MQHLPLLVGAALATLFVLIYNLSKPKLIQPGKHHPTFDSPNDDPVQPIATTVPLDSLSVQTYFQLICSGRPSTHDPHDQHSCLRPSLGLLTPLPPPILSPSQQATIERQVWSTSLCMEVHGGTETTPTTPPTTPPTTMLQLDLGTYVQRGAPALYHLFDKKQLPVCTTATNLHLAKDKDNQKSITPSHQFHEFNSINHDFVTFFIRSLTAHHVGKGFVVDVGAHIGVHTLVAASLGYRVIAFESSPAIAALFARTVAINNMEALVTIFQNNLADGVHRKPDTSSSSPYDTSATICLDTIVPYLEATMHTVENVPKVITLMRIGGIDNYNYIAPLIIRGGVNFFTLYQVHTILFEIQPKVWSRLKCDVIDVAKGLFHMNYIMTTRGHESLISNAYEFDKWYTEHLVGKAKEGAALLEERIDVVFTLSTW